MSTLASRFWPLGSMMTPLIGATSVYNCEDDMIVADTRRIYRIETYPSSRRRRPDAGLYVNDAANSLL